MGGGGKCLPISPFPDTAAHPESLLKSSPNALRCSDSIVTEQSDDYKAQSFPSSQSASETERHSKIITALMESYCSFRAHSCRALDEEKLAILRHKPGDWIEKVAGLAVKNYDVPDTTTLLLIGPQASGKSSLVNRITRVFEENSSGLDRAQVSHTRAGEGTCFLQEYPIPRNSTTLCVYDTRSLSLVPSENFHLLTQWMTEGVLHGEMVFHSSDDVVKENKMKTKAKRLHGYFCKKRTVNYVILVVNGVSILEALESKKTQYIDMIVQTFNSPYVSFWDNKPAVVITHGDELSLHDRAFVRANLGELLGIPPCMQIFDIPDNTDYVTEAVILDLLRFCIEHSDRNLPFKRTWWIEIFSLLSDALVEILEQVLDDGNDSDEDSAWEEVSDNNGSGLQDLLYQSNVPSKCNASSDHLDAIAKVLNESDDNSEEGLVKSDPINEAQNTLKNRSIMQELDRFELLILFVSCFVSLYALVRIIVLQME